MNFRSLFLISALFPCWPLAGETPLYYYLETPGRDSSFEIRAPIGHDFSDPYLLHNSGGVGLHWLMNDYFGVGLDAIAYSSSRRESSIVLEQELGPFGFGVRNARPNWSTAAVARLTPFAGLVNFFSSKVVPVDLILFGKLGAIRYLEHSTGLLVGAGLEVNVGFDSNWGMFLGGNWEMDEIPSRAYQSRVGFRLGPRVRF